MKENVQADIFGHGKTNVPAMVQRLREAGEDFEWYPTTREMVETVKRDIMKMLPERRRSAAFSMLDCGAGDGRVLYGCTEGERYAIEKAEPLLHAMPADIFIAGTEFCEQSLIDKKVDVVFSNPPYSEFEMWAAKIIREANALLVYLIIPVRWHASELVQSALRARGAKADVIATTNFLNAERGARAEVNILRIRLYASQYHSRICEVDPFDLWFSEAFALDEKEHAGVQFGNLANNEEKVEARAKTQLVAGADYIQVLEALYNDDMQQLFENYRCFERVDPNLLREVGVNSETVKASLRQRIAGLKHVYWQTFFNTFKKITSRLITTRRRAMLDKIMQHVHIDFTARNAYSLAIWAIKNANQYFDEQLVTVFERMLNSANVVNYKSNTRVFTAEEWRWCKTPENLEKVRLDLRVVLERAGGINTSPWQHEKNQYNGLCERGVEYLRDLLTVAHNLGFETSGIAEDPMELPFWESGEKVVFHAVHQGKKIVLMEVKAFKNGNFHIKFNQKFILTLNVEFGRLKGWLRSKPQAAEELGVKVEEVQGAFGSNVRLTGEAKNHLLVHQP